MERNTQKNGLVNLLGLLVACLVAAVIGNVAQSATAAVGAVFLGVGFFGGSHQLFSDAVGASRASGATGV